MTPEEVWRGKSDDELVAASRQLSDYTEVGQRVIVAELRRRQELGLISDASGDGDGVLADSGTESVPAVRQPSAYVVRLWRGDVPLATTYWVWGLAVNVAWLIVIVLTAATDAPMLGLIVSLLALSYAVFITVAIWRSAGRYKGKRIWAELARIAVAIGVARFVVTVLFGR